MNSRALIALALIIAAIVGAALWFLNSGQPPLQVPSIALATPGAVFPKTVPGVQRALDTTPKPKATAVAKPTTTPKPVEIADWDRKIDEILRANPDNSDAANSATAQMLINLLPTLPAEGQGEAAQHITNLLADKDYSKVMPFLKNPATAEEVLDVLVTDLMNRDDSVKLPALLEIAKVPNHPTREEALTDLQIFLDEDYGNDFGKWEAAMKAYLAKQAAENAENAADAPPVVTPPAK